MSGDNLAYEDKIREELIDGEIVAMSPRPDFNHSRVAGQIYKIFDNYLTGHTCTAIPDGLDLYLSEKDRFIPDMMVVCDRNKIKENGIHGAPDLVVEVFSPSTAKRDRGVKLQAYQKHGVREYWIVTPATRTIEQYLLQDGVLTLNKVYAIYPDYTLEQMTPEEKSDALAPLKCSLFDNLEIELKDIFNKLLPTV